MPYEPTVWQDHVTEYPGEYQIKKTSRGTYNIVPVGKVIQEGTPQNAKHFNKIENALCALFRVSHSVVNLGCLSDIDTLKNIVFEKDKLYRFSFAGDLAESIGIEYSDCLGTYGYESGPEGYLRFVNLETTKGGFLWINTGRYVENEGSKGVNGKSAYEIAVANGFEGSEEEWLESLKGADGSQGPQGEKGDTGAQGEKGDKGDTYTLTEADKNDIAKTVANMDVIPSYWQEHIEGKISAINALQTKGGKDCFSFIVMTDMHYPSNLGKNSPLLAKKILDECSIKYALCLGDLQTRGCHTTKELLLAENEAIEEMLSPVRNRLLQTEGNHDGSYGFLDRDGDGEYNNTDASGNLKPEAERETYVNNLTPAELHSAIYRKVGVVGNVCFDERGSGYYVDDTANKVRYIVLNTQCNDYELQEDGTSLYPKMWLMRFTQSQFDLVIEALNNIPADNWNVVVAGHCPLWQEIGDKDIMTGVLNAYKNKTAYSGEYAGTAKGVSYTNLAKPLSDNTTDTSNWINGYRISSGGVSAQSGKTVTNKIYATTGDVVRIKGVDFIANADRAGQWLSDDTFNEAEYVSAMPNAYWSYELENGNTHKFTVLQGGAATTGYVRFTFDTPANPENIIITVNEEIAEGSGYDAVLVNCDFSNAKGSLVGYFAGHVHYDHNAVTGGVPVITTRCDAKEENTAELKAERIAGTVTEQSFDVFTVNKAEGKIYATKIGAGEDRVISY